MKNIILIAIAITCLNGCVHHIVKKTDDKAVANKAVLIVGKTFSGIAW